jgi:hypothetical protein
VDIFKSRTFWTIILDIAGSLLLHYLAGEETNYLIITLQPLFVFVIAKFTIDDREKQLTARAEIAAQTEYLKAEFDSKWAASEQAIDLSKIELGKAQLAHAEKLSTPLTSDNE